MRSRPVRDTPVRAPPRSLDDMDGRGWEVRDGLRMVSRVSLYRVYVYVDWRGWEVWGWVVNG